MPHRKRLISDRIAREFSEAKKIDAAVGNARISAAVYKNGRLLGTGVNSLKTHPFQKKYGKNEHAIHLHAEIAAILKAAATGEDLSSAMLVVARAKHSGVSQPFVYGLARPCNGCRMAIVAAGIKQVYFSCDGDDEWKAL